MAQCTLLFLFIFHSHEGPRMSCKIIFLPLRKQDFEDLLTVILIETHCPTLPVPPKKNTKTWGRIVRPLQPYLVHPLNFNWNLGGNPRLKYSRRKKGVGDGEYKCHYLLPSTRHCQMGIVVGREVHTPSKGDCYPSHYRVGPQCQKFSLRSLFPRDSRNLGFFFFSYVKSSHTSVLNNVFFSQFYWDIIDIQQCVNLRCTG